MILCISSENNRPLFPLDQLLAVKEMNKVHNDYGIMGVYYVILYGWKASPYYTERDETRRASQVREVVMKHKEWYDDKNPLTQYPKVSKTLSFNTPIITAAIVKLNQLAKSPLIEALDLYKARLEIETDALDKEKGDPLVRKKIYDNIKTINLMIKDTEDEIEKKLRSKKYASLDIFVDKYL